MTTFKTYIEWVNKLYKDNPNLKEVQVITAGDDEGNSFHPVVYSPVPGHFEDGSFYTVEKDEDGNYINAVCLN